MPSINCKNASVDNLYEAFQYGKLLVNHEVVGVQEVVGFMTVEELNTLDGLTLQSIRGDLIGHAYVDFLQGVTTKYLDSLSSSQWPVTFEDWPITS